MSATLRSTLAEALGSPVSALAPVTGGDINDAYAATLATGEQVFVKTRADAPAGMYAREAEGLAWLAEAGALRTPQVRLVRDDMLVLTFVARAPRQHDFDLQLGRGLAAVHRFGAPCFGWSRDNFIANLPQDNRALPTFAALYRERRLMPLVQRARERGLLEPRDSAAFDRLYPRLGQLLGPEEPPARVHGDLWSGNVHVDQTGAPMLIDPAVYGGHRELDLAMLSLFGSPSEDFFAAYDEHYPRAPGSRERVALLQLYPLLVHVNLFGGAYVAQLRAALAQYV